MRKIQFFIYLWKYQGLHLEMVLWYTSVSIQIRKVLMIPQELEKQLLN